MHGNTSHENREIPGFSRRTRSRAGAGAQREVERRTPLMYESGKSDSRAVPRKAPNKAWRRAAEGLEGRRLAKRSSPQTSTLRTQGRTRAQAALGRVRQAAEQKKGALWPGTGGEPGRLVGTGATRGLPPAAGTTGVHPQARGCQAAAADRRDGTRGQDRPTRDGDGPQCRVRARVCRLLVWRAARPQRAPRAGGPGPSDRKEAGEVGVGRRSPRFLRIARA